MKRKPNKNFNFGKYLPFTLDHVHSKLRLYAQKLLEALGISAEIHLIKGDTQSGLDLERRFRLMWWNTGDEPLRLALYKLKVSIFSHSRVTQREKRLNDTWQNTKLVLRSTLWRQHLNNLKKGTTPTGESYLRQFFRTAQQVWSRAACWAAIMSADRPSPFIPLIELMIGGAWPLGCYKDSLWVFLWDESAEKIPDLGLQLSIAHDVSKKDYIFLSSLFQNSELTNDWELAFQNRGWKTLYGPVNEEIAQAEVQLGKQIREARAVVGLLQKIDPDFGIPWWMYQELDYACACKIPAILICHQKSSDSDLKEVQRIHCKLNIHSKPHEDHEIWHWLQKNVG